MKADKSMSGQLSSKDIKREIMNNNVFIHPFSEKSLTEVGYNLSPSDFVFSLRKGMLLEVTQTGSDRYVWVPANDTVLVLTREYVAVSKKIGGAFHSRVREVSQGFGHISTTLDPGWYGPLLIAITNPSRRRKLFICTHSSKGAENNTIVTMVLQYLNTEVRGKHDNMPFRFDILEQWHNNNTWLKKRFSKSLILLEEIIILAKSMSPDRADPVITTTVLDELQKFLASKIEIVREDSELLRKELYRLEFDFNDIRNFCSQTFASQYQRVMSLMDGAKDENDDVNLLTAAKALLFGCFYEKRRLRWDHYSNLLTQKISKYRTNRLLNLIIHIRENAVLYVPIAILVLAATILIPILWFQGIITDAGTIVAIASTLVLAVSTMLSSFLAQR